MFITPTDILSVTTSSTEPVDVWVFYRDSGELRNNLVQFTTATTTTIIGAKADTSARSAEVVLMTICNKGAAPNTVTVKIDDGANTGQVLGPVALAAATTLQFTPSTGWVVI